MLCWILQYKRFMSILERVQCSATNMFKGLEPLSYMEMLTELGLFNLEKVEEDLINLYNS